MCVNLNVVVSPSGVEWVGEVGSMGWNDWGEVSRMGGVSGVR